VVVVVVVVVAYVKPHVLNGILRRFIVVDVDALHVGGRRLLLFSRIHIHKYNLYIFLFFLW
jgi:hypothetical protein